MSYTFKANLVQGPFTLHYFWPSQKMRFSVAVNHCNTHQSDEDGKIVYHVISLFNVIHAGMAVKNCNPRRNVVWGSGITIDVGQTNTYCFVAKWLVDYKIGCFEMVVCFIKITLIEPSASPHSYIFSYTPKVTKLLN